jgi:predicted glycosyltransferase
MTPRVLFHVQHLLGIGHQRRVAAIAQAVAARGAHVTVLDGGAGSAEVAFGSAERVQLPAVRALDVSFKRLVDEHGAEVDDAFRERRRTLVLAACARVRPDVLVLEGYPFARRAFSFELDPLIAAAQAQQPRAAIVSSVRDVLVEKPDPERRRAVVERVRADFDRVLVHGDPRLIRLEDSFPEAVLLTELIRYTGYVRESRSTRQVSAAAGEVVVSAGGGAVGRALLAAALGARPLSVARRLKWRLLAGPNLPEPDFTALQHGLPAGIVVERFRDDFPALLRDAALSISQGGYNTVVDVLAAGIRAVIVPFAAPGETEQTRRAERLVERGLAQVISEPALTPESLAAAMDRALAAPPPLQTRLDFGGAEAAALEIERLWVSQSRNRP